MRIGLNHYFWIQNLYLMRVNFTAGYFGVVMCGFSGGAE